MPSESYCISFALGSLPNKKFAMKEQLALFPLQLVVFPNEKLNLHLFEPRYRQLLADVEAEGISFGIPSFLDDKIMPIGTEVVLKEVVERYPTGGERYSHPGRAGFSHSRFSAPTG